MELKVLETGRDFVRAGYDCPCGCTPSLAYARGASVVRHECCCGNTSPWAQAPDKRWALGRASHLSDRDS